MAMEAVPTDEAGGEVRRHGEEDILPRMICSVEEAKERLAKLQEFVREVLVETKVDEHGKIVSEGDYGPPFAGSKKKTLLKAGAEKLAEIYGYAVEPVVVQRIEKWTSAEGGPFFHYEVEARIYSKRTGALVGKGVGSCNSMENRYRWRQSHRCCPSCGFEGLLQSKKENKEWFCWQKKGGCGATFPRDCPDVVGQEVGRVENDDVHTLVNTILKMAKKRAYVDGVISVTQSSGIFTGDDGDGEKTGARARRDGAGDRRDTQSRDRQDNDDKGDKGKAAGDAGDGNGNGSTAQPDVGQKDDGHPLRVMMNGRGYWTAGIDATRMLRLWSLLKDFDVQHEKGAAKKVMSEIVGVTSSRDLSEEMADKLIAHVVDLMGGESDDDFNPY